MSTTVQITGKYVHQKNENLDDYFKAVGVPFVPRKMMLATSPTLEITNENDIWSITTSTMLRTVSYKFKLGEEYEEHMPGGTIKSTTNLEGNTLKTLSIAPDGSKVTRNYIVTDSECVIEMKHESSGIEAKRYFKRA